MFQYNCFCGWQYIFRLIDQLGVDITLTSLQFHMHYDGRKKLKQMEGNGWDPQKKEKKCLIEPLDARVGRQKNMAIISVEYHCWRRHLKLNTEIYGFKLLNRQKRMMSSQLFIRHKGKISDIVSPYIEYLFSLVFGAILLVMHYIQII